MNPSGKRVTLSPWLIHTFSMPWPFGGAEVLDAVEQPGVPVRPHLGVAELAVGARLHVAAQLHRHREHPVADAQHRHAGLPDRLGRAQVAVLVGAGVAAGEDDAPGLEVPDELVADVVGMDLAVDVRLAHAPGDQLRDLRTEIEDQDPVVLASLTVSSLVTRSLAEEFRHGLPRARQPGPARRR